MSIKEIIRSLGMGFIWAVLFLMIQYVWIVIIQSGDFWRMDLYFLAYFEYLVVQGSIAYLILSFLGSFINQIRESKSISWSKLGLIYGLLIWLGGGGALLSLSDFLIRYSQFPAELPQPLLISFATTLFFSLLLGSLSVYYYKFFSKSKH